MKLTNPKQNERRAFINDDRTPELYGTLAQFRRHLGRHMEQLALFALPKNETEGSEAEIVDGNYKEDPQHAEEPEMGHFSSIDEDSKDSEDDSRVGKETDLPDLQEKDAKPDEIRGSTGLPPVYPEADARPPLPPSVPHGNSIEAAYKLGTDDAECLKKLTTYDAYTIRKLPMEKPTWARAEITLESWSQEEILKWIRRLNERRTGAEKKQALATYQQGQVESVIDQLKQTEADQNFEWTLVQLDSEKKTLGKDRKEKKILKETTIIRVYVKRAPCKDGSPSGLFNEIERMKIEKMNQMGIAPPSKGEELVDVASGSNRDDDADREANCSKAREDELQRSDSVPAAYRAGYNDKVVDDFKGRRTIFVGGSGKTSDERK
jgi:hypothetical protein